MNKINDGASIGYRIEHNIIVSFSGENHTDAFIELLLWVKSQNREHIVNRALVI